MQPPPPAPPPPVASTISLAAVGTGFERPVLVTAPPGDAERVFVVEQTGTVRIVRDGEHRSRRRSSTSATRSRSRASPGCCRSPSRPTTRRAGSSTSSTTRPPGTATSTSPSSGGTRPTPTSPTRTASGSCSRSRSRGRTTTAECSSSGPTATSTHRSETATAASSTRPGSSPSAATTCSGTSFGSTRARGDPYAVPADNPFVGARRSAPRDLGVRPAQPVAILDRRRHAGDVHRATPATRRDEEVDRVPLDRPGANFGWPCFEGSLPFDATATLRRRHCLRFSTIRAKAAHAPSSAASSHATRGCPRSTAATSTATSAPGRSPPSRSRTDRVTASDDLGLGVPELTSFGVDGLGRIYVMSLGGDVYRLDPTPPR